jgi:hypothetical protein
MKPLIVGLNPKSPLGLASAASMAKPSTLQPSAAGGDVAVSSQNPGAAGEEIAAIGGEATLAVEASPAAGGAVPAPHPQLSAQQRAAVVDDEEEFFSQLKRKWLTSASTCAIRFSARR